MIQKTYNKNSVLSPYQKAKQDRDNAFNVQNDTHPAREEIRSCLGEHNLTVRIEEDRDTLKIMSGVEGLIAFLCTLSENGNILAQGRGSAVLSKSKSYIQRTIAMAYNSAIIDATVRATKVFETLRAGGSALEVDVAPQSPKATDKQIKFLRELIKSRATSAEEQRTQESKLESLSIQEASNLIASYKL